MSVSISVCADQYQAVAPLADWPPHPVLEPTTWLPRLLYYPMDTVSAYLSMHSSLRGVDTLPVPTGTHDHPPWSPHSPPLLTALVPGLDVPTPFSEIARSTTDWIASSCSFVNSWTPTAAPSAPYDISARTQLFLCACPTHNQVAVSRAHSFPRDHPHVI